MKYLKIKNDGLIEDGALTLIGASSKRGEEKIGQFGSGNKYAIAYLLRNNIEFKVFSGTNEIKVETRTKTFKDAIYNMVCVNGEQTSITTDMGVMDWSLWQALREIYSNAIDEGGESIDKVDDVSPAENETHFYIEMTQELDEIMGNFDKYFVSGNKRVVKETPFGRILTKAGKDVNIYRKGIRCFNREMASAYDYDIPDLALNESRIVKYPWTVREAIWYMAFSIGDHDILKNIFDASRKEGFIENDTTMVTLDSGLISPEFVLASNEFKFGVLEYGGLVSPEEQKEYTFIPKQVYKTITGKEEDELVNFHREVGAWREINKTPYHEKVINDALRFLRECKWHDIPYEIKVAVFESSRTYGLAKDNTIYISDNCLDLGVQMTVEAIIEEYIHLKHGVTDESRPMQDKLIQELVTYMKKHNAYVL